MQTEQIKESKLWEKVQCNISMLETTSNSPREIRAAITKVCASFHDYQLSVVSYIDFLVHANSPQCIEERENLESIKNNHKRYVDAVIAEGNERKKELLAQMRSTGSSSCASSVSSAALRAQARGEAAAAIKKAEMQKKRSEIESQLAMQIQEQELALS